MNTVLDICYNNVKKEYRRKYQSQYSSKGV